MALTCAISLNTAVYSAGQNPPPQATLFVYNPGAAAVVVTGVQLAGTVLGSNAQSVAMPPALPPIGPGMTVSVPAASSINIGPFPIVVASAANANAFQTIGTDDPYNAQRSQPPQFTLSVGALVYGSDGSVNVATPAGLTVSFGPPPPLGSQGGLFNFAGSANFITGLALGVL